MNHEEPNFDTDFSSDEEVEEMLDSIVTTIGEIAKEQDNQTSAVVNPDKFQQVLYTYKVLKYLTKGIKGVKVTCELNEPYRSMGSVSVAGEHLVFHKPEWFLKAVELSSNFDVYTKTDGTVQMDFTFHGLTIPFE